MKNTFLTLILFFITSITSVAQSSDWTLYKTIDGVKIFTKESDCVFKDGSNMDQTVILFKLENTTNKDIMVSWTLRVWYNEKEMINYGDPNQRNYSFIVDSNKSIEGDCSQLSNTKNLYLYKKFIKFKNSASLTRFEFENLTVK